MSMVLCMSYVFDSGGIIAIWNLCFIEEDWLLFVDKTRI